MMQADSARGDTMPAIRRNWMLLILTMAVFCACAQTAAPLNSDRIRQQFGSYGVAVLNADEHSRVSNLYSGSGVERVCRTLAIVEFSEPMPTELAQEHAAIEDGGSIGETFRNAGWQISKHGLGTETVSQADLDLAVSQLMKIDADRRLAAYVYDFEVNRGGKHYSYARITEIYHPDYLTLEDLSPESANK
jgi:hypothetical protein